MAVASPVQAQPFLAQSRSATEPISSQPGAYINPTPGQVMQQATYSAPVTPNSYLHPALTPQIPFIPAPAAYSYFPPAGLQTPMAPSQGPALQIGLPPELAAGLQQMARIVNPKVYEDYIRIMGGDIIFHTGQDALDWILAKGIRVEFGDMGDSKAHAQWIAEQNLIMINQKYQGDYSKDNLYSLACAIFHEAGHSKRRGDNQASVQEEFNCLSLNVLAYMFFALNDPDFANSSNNSPVLRDGVALYPRLFFDPDPTKQALVNRIEEKYGMLPASTPDHPIPVLPYQIPIADRVIRQVHTRQALNMVA